MKVRKEHYTNRKIKTSDILTINTIHYDDDENNNSTTAVREIELLKLLHSSGHVVRLLDVEHFYL